jgi:hypothetical protein
MAQDRLATAKVHNPGGVGIVKDKDPWLLPPEAWSNGINARFKKGNVQRSGGMFSLRDLSVARVHSAGTGDAGPFGYEPY